MKMPGGGPWKLYSGQITDDSELAMCMMSGIIESIIIDQNDKIESRGSIKSQADQGNESFFDPLVKNKLYVDCIAEKYKDWLESPPFDIGITTNQALSPLLMEDEPT